VALTVNLRVPGLGPGEGATLDKPFAAANGFLFVYQ
jgi:hypothetical protein